MLGSEIAFEYQLLTPLALSGALSYVQGELTATQQPLPWMPPLGGKLDLKYQHQQFSAGITWRSAAAQTRLGEFEEKTAGYSVFDLNFQYLFSGCHVFNSLDLGIQNLTNHEYRKHLSRVKSIMPEPGRNIKVLYRIYL
jgi:iron complex outermembrane receptor protein